MLMVGAIVSVGDGGITVDTPHLHRQLLQDSDSGSDCEPVLTYPSPCGLPVPKATIKLGNTGENVELIMFSFFLGLY